MTSEIDQLADQIAEMAVHIDAATHTLLTSIRAFDQRGGWASQGHQSCARWLSWRIGMGTAAASEHVRVANRLGELPIIDDALRTASISYSKVRAITRVATSANEAHLVELAKLSSGAQLEIACRKYKTTQPHDPRDEADHRYVRRRALDDGMVKIEISLRPDEAAKVFALIDARVKSASPGSSAEDFGTPYGDVKRLRPKPFDRADAFMAIVEQQVRGESPDRTPVELIVVVDQAGRGVTSDGTALPASTVERLACDAGIVEIVADAHGNVLDVGRKHRVVTPALKRALAVRDPHCRFPGCANRAFLDAHHVVHWQAGGATNLVNCVNVCTFHHDLLHTGYTCSIVDDKPVFRDPKGRPIAIVPEPRRPDRVGLDQLRANHADLALAPRIPATHVADHRQIVSDLCAAEDPDAEDRAWFAQFHGGRFDDDPRE